MRSAAGATFSTAPIPWPEPQTSRQALAPLADWKLMPTIIGALPIAVLALVYFTSPQYIELLWTTPMGHVMLAGSVLWMTMGILVMRKMINFDF